MRSFVVEYTLRGVPSVETVRCRSSVEAIRQVMAKLANPRDRAMFKLGRVLMLT